MSKFIKAGHKLGVTTDPNAVHSTTDGIEIGRFEVLPHESLTRFKLKVNGAYRIVRCLRSLRRIFVRS